MVPIQSSELPARITIRSLSSCPSSIVDLKVLDTPVGMITVT